MVKIIFDGDKYITFKNTGELKKYFDDLFTKYKLSFLDIYSIYLSTATKGIGIEVDDSLVTDFLKSRRDKKNEKKGK